MAQSVNSTRRIHNAESRKAAREAHRDNEAYREKQAAAWDQEARLLVRRQQRRFAASHGVALA